MRWEEDVKSIQDERNTSARSTLALLKIIAQGEADIAAGRLVSQEEAFAQAARAIDRARR